jgi:hypothetical protein
MLESLLYMTQNNSHQDGKYQKHALFGCTGYTGSSHHAPVDFPLDKFTGNFLPVSLHLGLVEV